MNISESLYNYLKADVALNTIISQKIFSEFLTAKTQAPYLVFEVSGEEITEHMTDVSNLQNNEFTFNIYGKTRQEVNAIKEAVKVAMRGLNRIEFNGIKYARAFQESSSDGYVTKKLASESNIYYNALNFSIFYHII